MLPFDDFEVILGMEFLHPTTLFLMDWDSMHGGNFEMSFEGYILLAMQVKESKRNDLIILQRHSWSLMASTGQEFGEVDTLEEYASVLTN